MPHAYEAFLRKSDVAIVNWRTRIFLNRLQFLNILGMSLIKNVFLLNFSLSLKTLLEVNLI